MEYKLKSKKARREIFKELFRCCCERLHLRSLFVTDLFGCAWCCCSLYCKYCKYKREKQEGVSKRGPLLILEAAYDSFHASRWIAQKRLKILFYLFIRPDHCIGSDQIIHNRVQKCPQTEKIYIFMAINHCASLAIKRKQIFYENHPSTATFSVFHSYLSYKYLPRTAPSTLE